MYLDSLNQKQREAVLETEGPVSVLAGAGSGKTKVLTTRIYHLMRQGVAPERILAVTFTNKAAREMRERLAQMLGDGASMPFVATFHGLGRELLERYGSEYGMRRHFSVYDRDDSERAVKHALKELGMDPKEVSPRALLARVSRAKGQGLSREEYMEREGKRGFLNQTAGLVWKLYDEALAKERALDFDDLIALPVRLMREHENLRRVVAERFEYLHIDEYQDTNKLQGELVEQIAGERKNVFVVGDIDQCLAEGTLVTLPDGSTKVIEEIQEGEEVLSNCGSGTFRPTRVTRVTKREVTEDLIRITTTSGRTLVSTKDHIHFAGYRLGIAPQQYFTYLMHKKGVGWRVGVSQTYTRDQRKPMVGFKLRTNHEHADELWVVGVFDTPQEARVHEFTLSLSYALPTIPFVARRGGSRNGYVHDQQVITSIFSRFDTDTSAKALLDDFGLSLRYPHHRAQATRSHRRNIQVTLCGERRGTTAMHRISMVGSDAEGASRLRAGGFSVRSARKDSNGWRFEIAHKDFGELQKRLMQLRKLFPDAHVVETARLGGKKENVKDGNALGYLPASSVLPGMALFAEDGGYDVVKKIDRVPSSGGSVYDLDVENTHNFIANGIITHNCIYTWRQATIENLLAFDETYPDAKNIVLEHNYRSTKTIVEASNAVIEKNRNRKERTARTDNDLGAPIELHVLDTAEMEARFVALDARARIRGGTEPEQIVVLYRTNAQSRALEEAFFRAQVPYTLLGTKYLERKEVKDAIAWLRLALDPERESDRVRAIQTPLRGIGKVSVAKIAAGQSASLPQKTREKVAVFEGIVAELHATSKTMKPSEFVRLVLERSGLAEHYRKGGEDDVERLENVQELATLATRYDQVPGTEGISAFLAETALAGDQDELDRPTKEKGHRGVMLMTVHAAKGLEFDVVYITGLEEGLFPHAGMDSDEERDEEEERRLFYVAMTRARRELILTLARVRRIYGTDFITEPSSFIADIDASLMTVSYDEQEPTIYI